MIPPYLMPQIDYEKMFLYKKDIQISNTYHPALCSQKVWNLTV